MRLSPKLAQKIIEEIKMIEPYVINIMDSDGVIIASSNFERIGELHYGAKKVLETDDYYIMGEEEANKYLRVLPGISLPIHFRDNIVGVIGIGDGTESAVKFGFLLRKTVELLIEQEFVKEEDKLKEQEYDNIMNRFLSEQYEGNKEYFEQRTREHGIDINEAYLIVTVWHNPLELEKGIDYHDMRRNVARQQNLFSAKLPYQGMNIVFEHNYMVFMIPYKGDEEGKSDFRDRFLERVVPLLNQVIGEQYYIGVDNITESMKTIHQVFDREMKAVKIATILKKDSRVVSVMDVYDDYMLLSIPSQDRKQHYERIFGKLLQEKDSQREQWLSTLEAFFKNDMSLIKTAAELFIHRNSLIFRLNRIHYLTGFHPQNFDGATKLSIALKLYKLDHLSAEEMLLLDSIN